MVSRSLAFVILSAVALSFIRARPAAHRLSVYSFIVWSPCLLQHVGGWFLTHGNLGSPRNAGTIEDLSVSGHWTKRQSVVMSESFAPTHASSAHLASHALSLHKCKQKAYCMMINLPLSHSVHMHENANIQNWTHDCHPVSQLKENSSCIRSWVLLP